ncbi:hypothetical protein ACO0LM_23845 [Undibacterium sp. Di26W]|uniref:hypothetical protein n=1 Tax=Undibacterium sp. Di26W TaxID=3413035 RepID=UPI003BF2F044
MRIEINGISGWNRKTQVVIGFLFLIFAITLFFKSSFTLAEVKIKMAEHFSAGTSKNIERIECNPGTKGRDLSAFLDCNYKIRGKDIWKAKEVNYPEHFFGGGDFGVIFYDQTAQPKVDIVSSASDDIPSISRVDLYYCMSVVDQILDQQPK